LADGGHTFMATDTDAAGNTSSASLALSVAVDTVAPNAPIITNDTISNTNEIVLTGTAEVNSAINVYDGATLLGSALADSSGAWNFITAQLADGGHTFTATDTDAAGNTSLVSQPVDPIIDTTAPAAPVYSCLSPVGDDGITNDNMPTLTGNAEANSTIKIYDGMTLLGSATANGSGEWSYTTAALTDGVHSLTTTDTDAAGNTSSASSALSVTIDTVAPTLAITAIMDTHDSVSLTGTTEAFTWISIFDSASGMPLGTTTSAADGTWNFGENWITATDFTVKATDLAGNTNQVDAHAPAPAFANLLQNTNGTVTISGTSTPDSMVSIYDGTDTTPVGIVTTSANGTWSFTSDTLSNSIHSFALDAVDVAGNTGASTGVALIGTAGNDTLAVPVGNNLMIGGGGSNTFVFGASFGKDVITDFQATTSNHDVLQFSQDVFSDLAAVLDHAAQVGSDVVITADAHDTVTLQNVLLSNLHQNDFHIV
jgi:hypothetical protein